MRGRRAGGKDTCVVATAASLAHTRGHHAQLGCMCWRRASPGKSALTHAGTLAGRQGEHLIADAAARSALAAIAPAAGDARRAAAVRIRVEVRVLPRTIGHLKNWDTLMQNACKLAWCHPG